MRYKATLLSIMGFTAFLYVSCKRNIASPYNNYSVTSFSNVFDMFWNKMSTNYVYWDIDTTHWDRVYYQYKPLFEKLDIDKDSDIRRSVDYFREMTAGLIDSHYTLTFQTAPVSGTELIPAIERKLIKPDFHSPFPYLSLDTNYLDKEYDMGYYITEDHQRLIVLSGTIQHKILYFYCNRFDLQEAWQSPSENSAKNTLSNFFIQLKNPAENIQGIIIDLRNNPGGNISDLNFFMGHFISKPLQFGHTRYKSGNGRLQYTPWINAIIQPTGENKGVTVPVIALADNYTISLAEAVTMAIQALPNGKVVGETTWGATGPVTSEQVYDDGSFSIPGFLSVTTSSAEFKYINDTIYEGRGFPPDIIVPFNGAAAGNGEDLSLEKAISLIQ